MDLLTPVLRLFFTLIYHQLAWTYDFVSSFVSGGRWKSWVLSTEALLEGPRVLEVGSGPGHLLARLSQSGFRAAGMDASRQMNRMARKKLDRLGLPVLLVRARGEDLPFRDGSFNSVAATFPAGYILQPAALTGINRILAPGGKLVILLSAWVLDPSPAGRALAWLYRVTCQALPQQFDMQGLLALFTEAGFEASTLWTNPPGSRLLFIVATKKNSAHVS